MRSGRRGQTVTPFPTAGEGSGGRPGLRSCRRDIDIFNYKYISSKLVRDLYIHGSVVLEVYRIRSIFLAATEYGTVQ